MLAGIDVPGGRVAKTNMPGRSSGDIEPSSFCRLVSPGILQAPLHHLETAKTHSHSLVNSILFHIFLEHTGLPMSAVFLALELYLAWSYRSAYRTMLAARVWPG